jgi:hypothetical protein
VLVVVVTLASPSLSSCSCSPPCHGLRRARRVLVLVVTLASPSRHHARAHLPIVVPTSLPLYSSPCSPPCPVVVLVLTSPSSCPPPCCCTRRTRLVLVLVITLASPSRRCARAYLPVVVLVALASCLCSSSHSPPLPRAYVHCFHSRSIRARRDVVVTCFCTSRRAVFSIRRCVCVRAPFAMHLRPSLCVHICLVRSACTCHLTHL